MNKFRLYISCLSEENKKRIRLLNEILKNTFGDKYNLQVIEITSSPDKVVEADEIVATPTLVRFEPQPVRKYIGDISNEDKVKKLLCQ